MDRYVVTTAMSANAFARLRHEATGEQLLADLTASMLDGTRAGVDPDQQRTLAELGITEYK